MSMLVSGASERKKKFSRSEVIPNGITSEEKKNSSLVK